MTDEIKFRAFYKPHKRMLYEFGDGAKENQGVNYILSTYQNDYNWALMRFTGLHDKNGKEIWEGDIVKFYKPVFTISSGCDEIYTNEILGLIEWNKVQAGFVLYNLPEMNDIYNLNQHQFYEVVGNAYENPELIHGSNKEARNDH